LEQTASIAQFAQKCGGMPALLPQAHLVLKINVSIILGETLTPNFELYLCRFTHIVIAAEYKLLFGISKAIPELPKSRDQRVANKDFCFLVVRCSRGRVGWFFFMKLDKKLYAPNIPRYTQKDAEAMVQPYLDFSITERVRLRDVWDNRIVSGLVPIQEYLAERWTWNRVVCVGDAIRKVCNIHQFPTTYRQLTYLILDLPYFWPRREYCYRRRC
jgi:hypothetical protein